MISSYSLQYIDSIPFPTSTRSLSLTPWIGHQHCDRSGAAMRQTLCHLCEQRCAGLGGGPCLWCRAPAAERPPGCGPAAERWPAE